MYILFIDRTARQISPFSLHKYLIEETSRGSSKRQQFFLLSLYEHQKQGRKVFVYVQFDAILVSN